MLKKLLKLFRKKPQTLSDYLNKAEKDLGVEIDHTFVIDVDGIYRLYTLDELESKMKQGSFIRIYKYFYDDNGQVDCYLWESFIE
jgi:hypothetical protein